LAGRALLDRRTDHRRRGPGRARLQQQRARGRRQHRPLHDDRAAVAAGMVQVQVDAGLRPRLADQLWRAGAVLRRSRRGAEDLRAAALSVGQAAQALSLPRASG